MRLLAAGLRLFLSLTLALNGTMAGATPSRSEIDILVSGSESIDESAAYNLWRGQRSDEIRSKQLHKHYENTGARKDFDRLLEAELADEGFRHAIERSGASKGRAYMFYLETLFLMRLLKNGHFAFAELQFENWRNSLYLADFRWVGEEYAERWSESLMKIYIRAFLNAGPWGPSEIRAVDEFIQQRPEIRDNRFRTQFAATDKVFDHNSKLKSSRGWRFFLTALGTFVITFVGGLPIMDPVAKGILSIGREVGLEFPALLTFILSYMLGIGTISFFAGVAGASHVTYAPIQKRFSRMLKDGLPTCEQILQRARP